MPRSDYGKMLKGHDPKRFTLAALELCNVLKKCQTSKRSCQVGHFGTGTRTPDVTLQASTVPNILFVRFRNTGGTFWYHVIVRKDSSLQTCCEEIIRRVHDWKPEVAVRLDENIFPQRERALPIPKDISKTESDHNSLEEQDGSRNISPDQTPWTPETALIYTIMEDIVTFDDPRARLYGEYAEVTGVRGIIKERCDMTYQQIADALVQLEKWGILVPIEQRRNAARRLQFVDHVPDFVPQQQEVTEQHNEVLPPVQEHTTVEQPKRILQDNSVPMDAAITPSDRNLLKQCVTAIWHGVSHILKTHVLVVRKKTSG